MENNFGIIILYIHIRQNDVGFIRFLFHCLCGTLRLKRLFVSHKVAFKCEKKKPKPNRNTIDGEQYLHSIVFIFIFGTEMANGHPFLNIVS